MLVSKQQLSNFFYRTPNKVVEDYYIPLNKTLEKFNINTPKRIAMFMAQIAHESAGLTQTQENLNYRADRLKLVFPRYFRNTNADPNAYARNPEKIANRVYANRMGNGPEASGDGYRYRGRGLIQLTGFENYSRFARAMELSLEKTVEYLETPEGAAMSAGWFWRTNGLNEISDRGDIVGSTKRINGGIIGLADRETYYQQALRVFS
jgi:putative chitinase